MSSTASSLLASLDSRRGSAVAADSERPRNHGEGTPNAMDAEYAVTTIEGRQYVLVPVDEWNRLYQKKSRRSGEASARVRQAVPSTQATGDIPLPKRTRELGRMLKAARETAGLTVEELADRIRRRPAVIN